MRPSVLILLLLPVADALLLVPAARVFGPWLWAWLALMAAFGALVLRQARDSVLRQHTGRAGWFTLQALLDNQRTVLAGFLLIWPGLVSDLIAFLLLATAPPPLAAAGAWEHPLMLDGRRPGC